MVEYPLVVDGSDYTVSVSLCGNVLEVYDCAGNMIADAENDFVQEALYYTHYETEFCSASTYMQKDLFEKGWREVATWLISTHPEYQ